MKRTYSQIDFDNAVWSFHKRGWLKVKQVKISNNERYRMETLKSWLCLGERFFSSALKVVCQLRVMGILMIVTTQMVPQTMAQEDSGPTSIRETYQDWVVTCQTSSVNGTLSKVCQMSQELRQQQTNRRALLVALTQPQDGSNPATITVIAPFGVLLKPGLDIELIGSELLHGEYRTCLPAGCVSEIVINKEQLGKLATGEVKNVVMTTENNQPLRMTLSLKGFTAAWNRIIELGKS